MFCFIELFSPSIRFSCLIKYSPSYICRHFFFSLSSSGLKFDWSINSIRCLHPFFSLHLTFFLLSLSHKFIPLSTLGRDLLLLHILQKRKTCFNQVTYFLSLPFIFNYHLYILAYPRTESQIHLELQDTELWSRFESLSTEMM
jgi:hypothetical protein